MNEMIDPLVDTNEYLVVFELLEKYAQLLKLLTIKIKASFHVFEDPIELRSKLDICQLLLSLNSHINPAAKSIRHFFKEDFKRFVTNLKFSELSDWTNFKQDFDYIMAINRNSDVALRVEAALVILKGSDEIVSKTKVLKGCLLQIKKQVYEDTLSLLDSSEPLMSTIISEEIKEKYITGFKELSLLNLEKGEELNNLRLLEVAESKFE